MTSDSPEHAVEMVDAAFNRGDLEAVLDFYEANAVVVMEPDSLARGHQELRDFFTGVMRAGSSARQLKTSIIEADGVALFLSRWTLDSPYAENAATNREFIATTVLRRQADGRWRALIDNPIGPLVLGG
jgi:ketosteroid isomerase-like protein